MHSAESTPLPAFAVYIAVHISTYEQLVLGGASFALCLKCLFLLRAWILLHVWGLLVILYGCVRVVRGRGIPRAFRLCELCQGGEMEDLPHLLLRGPRPFAVRAQFGDLFDEVVDTAVSPVVRIRLRWLMLLFLCCNWDAFISHPCKHMQHSAVVTMSQFSMIALQIWWQMMVGACLHAQRMRDCTITNVPSSSCVTNQSIINVGKPQGRANLPRGLWRQH